MTRYERMMQMTLEETARVICSNYYDVCEHCIYEMEKDIKKCSVAGRCFEGVCKWLEGDANVITRTRTENSTNS